MFNISVIKTSAREPGHVVPCQVPVAGISPVSMMAAALVDGHSLPLATVRICAAAIHLRAIASTGQRQNEPWE